MGILKQPETTYWVDELHPDGCLKEVEVVTPAHLTTFGEKVNKVLHFVGLPELEVQNG